MTDAQEAGMASEPKYYSVDGVSGPIQPAAASEQPTAAPQVREVIVGLQENIEQLCALLLQRTGEDRGKLAAGSAPPDLNDAIAAIEEIVGSEELEEWGLEKANGKLSERELAMYERLSKAYQISHAFNPKHSCYKVHEDWRRLARAALQGEPGGEK